MDRRSDPFDDLERMLERMGEQFGDMQPEFGAARVPVDLRETEDRFVLTAEVPGFAAGDIDLQISDGRRVDITGERETEREAEGEDEQGRFVTRERHRDALERTVTLPEAVDEEAAEASYNAGVLTVSLPKRSADEEGTDIPVS